MGTHAANLLVRGGASEAEQAAGGGLVLWN